MDELFETLDSDSGNEAISGQLQKGYKEIAPWIQFVAIGGIISQSISFLVSFFNPTEGMFANVIGLGIGLALNITLLQFGKEMTNFGKSGSKSDLEAMFKKELGYWIFVGVLIILGLSIGLLGFILVTISGGRF